MKRIIFGILIITMLLSSCTIGNNINEVTQTNDGLSIYIGNNDTIMELALPIFQQKYPDIEVEVIRPQEHINTSNVKNSNDPEEQERDAFLAKIMSGGGPDLLCSGNFYGMMDYERLVLNGVPADMSEFYDTDIGLSQTLYQQIMDGGVFDEKRYYFPLDFNLSILLSTQKTLEKFGLKEENCPDYKSFLIETGKIIDNGIKLMTSLEPHFLILEKSGVNPVDIKNGKINTDLPEIKITYEWFKKIINQFPQDYISSYASPEDTKALINGDIVFLSDSITGTIKYNEYESCSKLMLSSGETPVLFPIRNNSGGLTVQIKNAAFVRANSPNKENAYKFIKILLSTEVQSHRNLRILNNISVSKQAMDDYFTLTGLTDAQPLFTRELHDKYLKYIDEVTDVKYYDLKKIYTFFIRSDLYDGKTYEESAANVKQKIEFILSE